MTWFQIPTITIAVVLGLRSLVKAVRGTGRGARLVQLAFAGGWLLAAVCLAMPDMTTSLARQLGIGRGADLVLYGLALGSFWFAMFTYYRLSALRRDITGIVRHLAIREAEQGAPLPQADAGEAQGPRSP